MKLNVTAVPSACADISPFVLIMQDITRLRKSVPRDTPTLRGVAPAPKSRRGRKSPTNHVARPPSEG